MKTVIAKCCKTLPQIFETFPATCGGHTDKYLPLNGLVCIDAHRLLVPSSLEDSILMKAHTPAHQGINKSKEFLRSKYFFLKMSKKIEAIVSQCMDCQRYLPSQADKPTIPLMATRPMEVLDSDCLNLMANTMLSSVTGSRAIYGLRG